MTIMIPAGPLCTLAECPPGPFETVGGALGFKTEYGATEGIEIEGSAMQWTVTSKPDAYVLLSGERYHGPKIVQPLMIQRWQPVEPS